MSATAKTTSGQVLPVARECAPEEMAIAAMEACLRHAIARLQEGVLQGSFSPEPASPWRGSWHPVDAETVDVGIAVGHPIDTALCAAVSERIRRLGFDPIVQFVRGEGVEWIVLMEVRPL